MQVRLSELDAFCAREGAPPATKPVVLAPPAPAAADAPTATGERAEPEAAEAPMLHQDIDNPRAYVKRQVECLRESDFTAAFGMNSPANRARIGGVEQFEALVGKVPSFAALADPKNEFKCLEDNYEYNAATATGRHTIEVTVQAAQAGALVFAFEVSERDHVKGFATEGVRIVC